jgi:acetyltransferase
MPLPEFWNNYKNNSKFNKPIFKQPEDPAEIISNILLFNSKKKTKSVKISKPYITLTGIKKYQFLAQNDVAKLCRKYKLPVVSSKLLSEKEIKQNLKLNFPVVVKGLNKKVVHKTELNAVKVDIKNKKELLAAVKEIKLSFKRNGFEVEKFLIQPFIKTKHELLIGGARDNSFGPIIMFGSGGKYVEMFEDTSIRSAYLTNDDIDEMINETKIGKILKGVRGEQSIDIIELRKVIKSVSKIMIENKKITELDINPLIVDENNKLHAVDVRVKT